MDAKLAIVFMSSFLFFFLSFFTNSLLTFMLYRRSSPGLTTADCTGPCADGYESDSDGNTDPECGTSCPAGRFSTMDGCQDCVPGRYQDQQGQVECLDCPGGRYGSEYRMTDQACSNPCLPGVYGLGRDTTAQCSGACEAGTLIYF